METTETTTTETVPPVTTKTETTAPPEPVIDPAFKRLKDDLNKEKLARKAAEDKFKAMEEEKLKANKSWEELAKLREDEAKLANDRASKMEKAVLNDRKYSAIRQEAVKAGIHEASLSDLDLLDFPEIDVETTSNGKILVHGAAQAVAGLKVKRPHWFNQKPASVNPHTPETNPGASGKMDVSKAIALEEKYRKNPNAETKAAYEKAVKELQKG